VLPDKRTLRRDDAVLNERKDELPRAGIGIGGVQENDIRRNAELAEGFDPLDGVKGHNRNAVGKPKVLHVSLEYFDHPGIALDEECMCGPPADRLDTDISRSRKTIHEGGADDAVADYMPKNLDLDLMAEFINESTDLIQNAEEALLSLEHDPGDVEAVGKVFRAFHTVKGTSAFLELSLIAEFGHHAETLLSRVRDGEIRYSGGYADLSLQGLDMIKTMVEAVKRALEKTPPDLAADIHEKGFWLAGGGALIRGLDKLLVQYTSLKVNIADDPLTAVVRGAGAVIDNLDHFRQVFIN